MKRAKRAAPLAASRAAPKTFWLGPQQDGITNSLLGKFLVCRDRFRFLTVLGLKEAEPFNHSIEYGTLWHAAEEAHFGKYPGGYKEAIRRASQKLLADYPGDEAEVNKWVSLCLIQFPVYLQHYAKKPQRGTITYPLQEYAFRVRYDLPSRRYVYLRGKIDGIRQEGDHSIYVKENKTKGTIDEEGITKTVKFNIQTMIYFIAYRSIVKQFLSGAGLPADLAERLAGTGHTLKLPTGVLYNVIRRPLSEKYAPRQKKAESTKEFYQRVGELQAADATKYFFQKKVLLTVRDVNIFETETFQPILEQLCDWWEWISIDPANPFRTVSALDIDNGLAPYTARANIPGGGIHWRAPFGVYNSLFGGFRGDYFEFLTSGNRKNLTKADTLFPELDIA